MITAFSLCPPADGPEGDPCVVTVLFWFFSLNVFYPPHTGEYSLETGSLMTVPPCPVGTVYSPACQ